MNTFPQTSKSRSKPTVYNSAAIGASPTSPQLLGGNDSKVADDAILASPPNSTRRWRHKKHFQTIVNKKRYQYGSPMQAVTPGSMEADMRRGSIKDSLRNILDNIDGPSLD
jgi:hypothetical protein